MPSLIPQGSSALILIDFQPRILAAMSHGSNALAKAGKLAQAASELGIARFGTEQYPEGLGPTAPDVAHYLTSRIAKNAFDVSAVDDVAEQAGEAEAVILTGVEAHVCVLQSAFGFLQGGRKVYVVEDAIASRCESDRLAAIRRVEHAGAEIVTAEMVMFEWLRSSAHPKFREVQQIIKRVDA